MKILFTRLIILHYYAYNNNVPKFLVLHESKNKWLKCIYFFKNQEKIIKNC